jgi:N-acetylglucosaminyl-diphospho-decaprenol L-rhamnosyltransferase
MSLYNDITILIVTYKSEHIIKKTIGNLNSNFNIIVCENSSNIIFKELIEKEFFNTSVILTGGNLGVSRAVNIGLKQIKTKFAFFLTPDTFPEKDCLEKLYNIAIKNFNAAIVAPTNKDVKLHKYYGYFSNFFTSRNEDYFHGVKCKHVDWVFGCALLLNINKISEIGFFDESFFLDFEELDLCFRSRKNNFDVILSLESFISSKPQQSVNSNKSYNLSAQRMWHYGWSSFYFYKKNFNFFYSLKINLFIFFKNFIKMIYHLIFFNKIKFLNYFYYIFGFLSSVFGRSSFLRKDL